MSSTPDWTDGDFFDCSENCLSWGRHIVRQRWDFVGSRMTYDREVKPIEVAKDFFEDVILKVLALG